MGFAIFPIFFTRQHTDTIQEHHATVPYFSGADKAILSNLNTIFPPKQHIKHGVARLTTQ